MNASTAKSSPASRRQACAALKALPPVPSTLRIPLAGRALGDGMFPHLALNDAYAADTLAAIGDDGSRWVKDRYSMWGVLVRTRFLREQALAFIAQHPRAHIVNIGCGLSQYFQWLDNGRTSMTDADLPPVAALRAALLPRLNRRQRTLALDLARPDWWQQLHLPRRQGQPLFIMLEGVSMYLQPAHMAHVLHTVGAYAPAGSVLALDAFSNLACGYGVWHASLRQTGADICWGLRNTAQLEQAHPRLRLLTQRDVMAGYDWTTSLWSMQFHAIMGLPFYAMYVLGVRD